MQAHRLAWRLPLARLCAEARGLVRSRFARNWSCLVASSLVCQGLGMLSTIRIARELAPAGYGRYNLTQTLAGLGVVLAELGLRNVVIRETARRPERSGELLLISGLLRGAALAVAAGGILAYGRLSESGVSLAFGAAAMGMMIGQSAWDLLEYIAFGHERMEYSAGINLAGSAIWMFAVWGAPRAWLTAAHVSLGYALLQSGKALAYGLAVRRAGYARGGARRASWRASATWLAGQGMPFYWLTLLTAASNQLPVLFLNHRSGAAQVGLYHLGWRLTNPLQMLVLAALSALYPGLSQAGAADAGRFMRSVERALVGITLLGVAGAAAISLLRQEVVLLLFGPAYRATADAMAYQCWYTELLSVYSLIGTALAARDRQKWLAGLCTCYTALATPILWWGAGRGAAGLALAIVAGAVLNMGYHWEVFQRRLPRRLGAAYTLRLLALQGAGMALAWLVPPGLPLAARLALALMGLAAALGAALALFMAGEGRRPTSAGALAE